jgi:hypothetical protein
MLMNVMSVVPPMQYLLKASNVLSITARTVLVKSCPDSVIITEAIGTVNIVAQNVVGHICRLQAFKKAFSKICQGTLRYLTTVEASRSPGLGPKPKEADKQGAEHPPTGAVLNALICLNMYGITAHNDWGTGSLAVGGNWHFIDFA